ncbi:rRNA biogenesis protein rrp5 [Listeria monocytogenes]|uniref:rRNA biogenesis protein rrp5 n=1 Tax=Listeria monocytogenes TaxID=1639 RepID=UPI00098540A7|nr:rRNA biogenesis protein rrp5 [Listeria monocytogenes]
MSKIKLLLEVVNDMRSLADSIQAVCDAMTEGDPAPGAKAATEQEPVKEPDIPLEKVRMVLAEKSQIGFTAEVRGLIQKYGADKLSAVDKTYYADILKDAEGLGNG